MMESGSPPVLEGALIGGTEQRRVLYSPSGHSGHPGQVFTPMAVAELLAGMFEVPDGPVRVLDAGAGVGSLVAALVARAAREGWRPDLTLTAVEVDGGLIEPLTETLRVCESILPTVTTRVLVTDFIGWGCGQIDNGLFSGEPERFDLAILNPPYRKLGAGSSGGTLLSRVGINVRNLYAAFVTLSLRLLEPGGQLVAIVPRSFCNGPYFRDFRRELLDSSALRGVHLFETRDQAFRDAGVLQENVIVHLVKGGDQREVRITSSRGDGVGPVSYRSAPFSDVVHRDDPDRFVRLVTDDAESRVANRIRSLAGDLPRIGVSVSTGRVVDFRARPYLRSDPEEGAVPLIYPLHLRNGRIRWPMLSGRKPNALVDNDTTARFLLPTGNYVLVKRFTSKEQRRRVVASVMTADDLPYSSVGIENHINVLHRRHGSLPIDLAWGLAAYLNSTTVDTFFRHFNGHTQVNATDLRSLRYPTADQLTTLGEEVAGIDQTQAEIDACVMRYVPELAGR